MSGQTILHYEFLEKIGSGGMGEVFKAHDKRLNRFVAIKALPYARSGDPERRRRFMQEAQAASSLSHPNIITIHDIFQEGDTHFLVMEYVAGRTLLELIPPTGMPVGDVLSHAAQMADALSTAHQAAIIHRDFKPANVMIATSGLVKILDFGLAKLLQRQAAWMTNAAAASDNSATMLIANQNTSTSGPQTAEGSILGTVNYMSPEQAEGKPVDGRSDIFSLGAVLYEMLTGRRAFQGASDIATLSAVLRDEVMPISKLAPEVPDELQNLVNGCLRKDPNARWQTMKEVELELIAIKRRWESGTRSAYQPAANPVVEPPKSTPPVARSEGRSVNKVLIAGAACALLLLTAGLAWWLWPKAHPQATVAATPVQQASSVPQAANPQPPDPTPAPAPAPSAPETILPGIPPRPGAVSITAPSTNPIPPKVSSAPAPAPVVAGTASPPPVASSATPPPNTSSAPAAAAQAITVSLGDGTPFRIALAEDVANDAREGQAITFRASDDLKLGDTIVVAKGATVAGEIVSGNGKKFLGMGGRMTFKLNSVESVDGQTIAVRAAAARRADGPTARPLETGKYAKPKELAAVRGTDYMAYIDGAQTITLRK
jgi:serine/threonine protein kinase